MAVPSSSGEPWHDADQASVELEKLLLEPEASVKHSKARTRQLGLLAIFGASPNTFPLQSTTKI